MEAKVSGNTDASNAVQAVKNNLTEAENQLNDYISQANQISWGLCARVCVCVCFVCLFV